MALIWMDFVANTSASDKTSRENDLEPRFPLPDEDVLCTPSCDHGIRDILELYLKLID